MKQLSYFLLIIFFISFQNCNNDDVNSTDQPDPEIGINDELFKSENFGSMTSGDFIGLISDNSGAGLFGVMVTVGTASATTDQNGIFVINDADVYENFAFIKAYKEGFIQASRVVIPKENGVNNIRIVLLEKEVTESVASGQPSQVSLDNGAKVSFDGNFITENGDAYNGQVDVVLHYLAPNEEGTFLRMPGSLFAQTSNNDARSLITYGMLSVKLFSPTGEPLNINENGPATIEFPVDISQTSIAPQTIQLWYFDEEQGFWKEQGQANKIGNSYVGEVTHFTWWNVDIPVNHINLCFSITPNNTETSTYYRVKIKRNLDNQIIFSGYVLSNDGYECGFIPEGEEVTVSVYSIAPSCSTVPIYEEVLGGYTTDTNSEITFTNTIPTTTITGFANNCSGDPVQNGYIYVDEMNSFTITDGIINISIEHCTPGIVNLQLFDFDTNLQTSVNGIGLNGELWDLETQILCAGGFFNGDVTLLTQEEVDEFGSNNFTSILGDLSIGNATSQSNITNLSSLTTLDTVLGSVRITGNNNLTSLSGLNNLTTIDGLLVIEGNSSLPSLMGLNSLTSSVSIFIINNSSLSSILQLNSVTSSQNRVVISNNDSLTSLNGLGGITSINSLRISSNLTLSSISGLENLASLEQLYIEGNSALTTLTGLDLITNIYFMWITDNSALINLNGLENLQIVNANNIFPEVLIGVVVSDDGFYSPAPNSNLSDFCALQNLYVNGNGASVEVVIANNSFNPTSQDIINGNCSQ